MLPLLQRAARRCGEGQSHTHAAARTGVRGSSRPGPREQPAAAGLPLVGGRGGCQLLGGGPRADRRRGRPRRTTAEEAALIDAAYFPPIGALTVLLDDLIDRDDDLEAGEHNYLRYYANEAAGGEPDRPARRAGPERRPRTCAQGARHRAILAGVAGFYLSAPATGRGYARPIRERLLESLDPTVRPIMLAMRLRRHG